MVKAGYLDRKARPPSRPEESWTCLRVNVLRIAGLGKVRCLNGRPSPHLPLLPRHASCSPGQRDLNPLRICRWPGRSNPAVRESDVCALAHFTVGKPIQNGMAIPAIGSLAVRRKMPAAWPKLSVLCIRRRLSLRTNIGSSRRSSPLTPLAHWRSAALRARTS